MAKYVLLIADDDADAERLIGIVQSGVMPGLEVRAVYQKPTKFCHCTSVRERGWKRGNKFGWWICSLCNKPSEAWSKGDGTWYTALGKNLLPSPPEWNGQ